MGEDTPIDIIRSTEESPPLSKSSTCGHQEGHVHDKDLQQLQQDDVASEKPSQDVPPDGGYGWVCVACVFWINAHTWGINSVSQIPVPRPAQTKRLIVPFPPVIWRLPVLLSIT